MTAETPTGAKTETAQARLESLGYAQQLDRSMRLRDVVVYGLIFMCPVAPLPVFGFIYNLSGGQVAMVYIVAAIAMCFSAVSYAEMAKVFPVAGSVYSYVRFGAGEFLGFMSGWAILLDYLLLPGLTFIFAAAAMHILVPAVPQWVWIAVFVLVATLTNLRGVTFASWTNLASLYVQLAVLAVFVVATVAALWHGSTPLSLDPLVGSDGFSMQRIFAAIPIAALSYLGFDAISTLNEEAKGGGQTVARATLVVLVAVTALFVLQVYLAALWVPAGTIFRGDSLDTAFYDVAITAVGPWFQLVITITAAVIAMLTNAIVSQATTSRLIFSMARDRQLPGFLAAVDRGRRVPVRAILLVAVLSLSIGIFAVGKADLITSLVTFGSLTAYVLLHVAVMHHFAAAAGPRSLFKHWISPLLGLVIIGYALWSASPQAKALAGGWLAAGVIGLWVRRNFFPQVVTAQAAAPTKT